MRFASVVELLLTSKSLLYVDNIVLYQENNYFVSANLQTAFDQLSSSLKHQNQKIIFELTFALIPDKYEMIILTK